MTQPGVTDWIDVSVTVRHGMPHWPDNPPIVLERVLDLRRGDECNVSHLAMGVHTGTHMDAPVHFIHQGTGLDEMPLAATMGEARVVEIEHPRAHLAQTKVRAVGVDYLSVGGYHADGAEFHRILLEAGIWIIEGLDLSPVTAGRYEMICLPVKLHGCDGAPARAILRPTGGPGTGRAAPAETAQ